MKKYLLNILSITIVCGLVFVACDKKEKSKEEEKEQQHQQEEPIEEEIIPEEVIKVTSFSKVKHYFANPNNQAQEGSFLFPEDMTKTKKITMHIKLECPCNEWDVFANVYVKDKKNNIWLEMGRYITPYGVDNHQLKDGFEIDVTDFKSLLTGEVELKSYVETWGSDGWNISIWFNVYRGGKIDYPYSAVTPIIQYNKNSLEGVPYGKAHDKVLSKNIQLPENVEKAHLRTIITGWGHATPNDADGRPCAEWCFRTHHIAINGTNTYEHYLGPIGCNQNPVSPQYGNWNPDRAGWCPGMAVPVRTDDIANPQSLKNFNFSYNFEDWTDNGGNAQGAYYAISTFVVVESKTPIAHPVVSE